MVDLFEQRTISALIKLFNKILAPIVSQLLAAIYARRREQGPKMAFRGPHLNGDKIESNLSVPGIQECHENALYESFEKSLLLICL